MPEPKSRSQERRMEAQQGYSPKASEAAQRIKDLVQWKLVNEDKIPTVPEIARIIQEIADKGAR